MSRDADMTAEALPFDAQSPPFTVVGVPVLAEFTQQEALVRIAQLVAAQLHAGLAEYEVKRRLHGWVLREGE